MSEVEHILSALEADLEVSNGLNLLLLDGDARGEGALEGIDRLAVRTEVEETNLSVILASELGDDTASDGIRAIDDNQLHFVLLFL